ncbi:MAG: Ig-like domain-containing protein [Patescibacteria group bacterium]
MIFSTFKKKVDDTQRVKVFARFCAVLFFVFLMVFSVGKARVYATISSTPVHQYTGASISGSSLYSITLTSTPAQDNTLIFVQAGGDAVNHHAYSLVQTGVIWAKATSSIISGQDIWYGKVGASAGTILDITLVGSPATVAVSNLSEWSGISPVPLDQTGLNSGTSATPSTATITPQSGADVLIIGVARKGGTGTVSSPFTALSTSDGSFSPSYRVVTSASGSYAGNWTWTSSGGWSSTVADFLAQIVDTNTPSVPSSLSGTAFSPSRVDLSWASSTDNQAVDHYTLYRCSGSSCSPTSALASTTVLSYSDTTLSQGITYGYSVTATDLQSNESSKSSVVYVTTPSSDTLPPVLSNGAPIGTVTVNPLNTTLSVTTDENATCKYSTSSGVAYASIANTFNTTGGTSHSQSLTGLSVGSNTYYVRCSDSSGNANASDYTITFTMALADITAPAVNITAPTLGSTVSNTLTFTASASDNIGVVGLKFMLDGINFGTERTGSGITSSSTSWSSSGQTSDGVHSLIAVARDAAGNYATSSAVTFTINNSSNWKFKTVVYNGATYNFSVFVPPAYATSTTTWPIILSLPGQASFPFPDNDGYSQTRLDFGEYTVRGAESTFPAIVVIPQYVNTPGLSTNDSYVFERNLGMAAFNQELAEYNVDTNRIYLEGSSFGGLRAWGVLYNNPNLFAAAVTLSGGNSVPFEITGNTGDSLASTNTLTAARLMNLPVWMFHSAGDGQVSVQYDRDMYAALQSAGSTVVNYTEYPGSTHGLWFSPYGFNDPAITTPTALSWLMAQRLIDTTVPTVSITAPSNSATVSGSSVTVSASASDNIGVSGVQFKLDGALLGSEDTTSTYGITWDSTSATNGSHTLLAVARDAAGNRATSTAITVTVSNTVPDVTAPVVSSPLPSGTLDSDTTSLSLSVITDESATCKFGTTSGVAYVSISNTFGITGGTLHSESLTGLVPGTYTYYVRCSDGSSNINSSDTSISFVISPASTIINTPITSRPPSRSGRGDVEAFNPHLISVPVGSILSKNATDLIFENRALIVEADLAGVYVPALMLQTLGVTSTNSKPLAKLRIVRDLKLNAIGTDVRRLQEFLIARHTGPASEALAEHHSTAIFGILTQAALAEFQASVGIEASGYYGEVINNYLVALDY